MVKPGTQIEAIIFDADGVLQRPVQPWRPAFTELFGLESGALDALLNELYAAEIEHLVNLSDFRAVVFEILKTRGLQALCDQAMEIFHAIELNDQMIEIVRKVRSSEIYCLLGTNQQFRRADHMSDNLGYRALFDREFYSCRMGVAKPSPSFFEFILEDTGLRRETVLFIDDREENVKGALTTGIHAFLFKETEGAAILLDRLAAYGVTF